MAVICRTCKEIKELTEFVKNNQRKNGYDTRCKKCHAYHNKKYIVQRRKENQKPKEKIIIEKKYCYCCLIEKNIYEFSKCHSNLDGHRGKCKSCAKSETNKRNQTRINYHYHKKELYCFVCKIERPILDFSLTGLRRREPKCKECYNLNYKKRSSSVSTVCKITHEEFKFLLNSQNNVCAICEKPETLVRNGKIARISVDHCHESGKIRGLLCSSCNRGIGFMKDSSNLLRRAAKYLEENG